LEFATVFCGVFGAKNKISLKKDFFFNIFFNLFFNLSMMNKKKNDE
jgi:hypothetical protein